ncbi:MAG: helix-turn-helix domain-containing protein [Ramlibacter sp.]
MTEAWGEGGSAALAGAPAAGSGVTAGELLRRAREATGLHVAALAVSLKVPVRKLEALEENRWDLLPDSVFVRALASSVCRTLKIDAQPVLDLLPQNAAPRLVRAGDGINTPFRSPGDGAAPTWYDQLTKPVFLVVFALLLGALVLILLPVTQRDEGSSAVPEVRSAAQTPAIPKPVPAAAPAAAPSPNQEVTAPAGAPVAAKVSPELTPPTAAAAPVATPAAKIEASTAAPVAAAQPPGAAAAPPTDGIVVIRTKGPSWVEVTDAKGAVAVRKLLAAGESAGASGALPLQVTIGRADATEVQVRGKAFDLKPVSRDNVARFEVK